VTVFVTDGEQRATLAVVRALGRAGISVTVGSEGPRSLAGSSRYCTGKVCYPSPSKDARGFQAFLREEMMGGGCRVLLPMTDVTMRLVAQMRAYLVSHVRLPIPSEEEIKLAQDKRQILLLALQLGIACPETFMLQESESLAEVAQRVRYPVVVKPRFSWFLRDGTCVPGTVQYARDPEDLLSKYQSFHRQIPFPLVQEKIEGEGRGVFLLVWDGELKAAFCHRRLREKPPWGGPSVYCESVTLDKELLQKSFELLQATGWQGPAMVEFKVDNRDGRAKLMEVNGRFWGSLQLAIDAGINFPLLLYRLANGEDVPPQLNYQVGVKSRWLLGDLDHLLIRLAGHGELNGCSSQGASRLRTCLDFMKFYERNLRYEVFRLEDPGPGWYECKSYFGGLLRRFAQRTEGASAR